MLKYEHILYVALLQHNIEDDINYIWQLSEILKSRLGFALLVPTLACSEKHQERQQAYLYDHILGNAYKKLTTIANQLKIPQQDLYLQAGECLYKLLSRLLSQTHPDLIIISPSLFSEEKGHSCGTIINKGISILKLTAPVIKS
ncbi:hypothetical protein DA717_12940 [Piscirickettsiaceae bacterium NZ-RLO2]|uniref:hypothetical protein n=1 Tax=Piscirickettsia salmonis TaxID=1238 RepID=UPI000F0907FB|nr:hypothetical protein DA717_12940 [Piscirickettsiaceae bacterium NZ-RLO2]